jgi:hypothetical protein
MTLVQVAALVELDRVEQPPADMMTPTPDPASTDAAAMLAAPTGSVNDLVAFERLANRGR